MKKKVSFIELIRKNKEELQRDRVQLERIEKRVDDKYAMAAKSTKGLSTTV